MSGEVLALSPLCPVCVCVYFQEDDHEWGGPDIESFMSSLCLCVIPGG